MSAPHPLYIVMELVRNPVMATNILLDGTGKNALNTGENAHSSIKFAGKFAVSTTRLRFYFRTEWMKRMASDRTELAKDGWVDFQRGKQESFMSLSSVMTRFRAP